MYSAASNDDSFNQLRSLPRDLLADLLPMLAVEWFQLPDEVRPETRAVMMSAVRQSLQKLRAAAPTQAECRRLVVSALVHCFVKVALEPQLQLCMSDSLNKSMVSPPSVDTIRAAWHRWCDMSVNVLTAASAPLHPIVGHRLLESVINTELDRIVTRLREKLTRLLNSRIAAGSNSVPCSAADELTAARRKAKRRELEDPDDVRGRRKRLKLFGLGGGAGNCSASFIAATPTTTAAAATAAPANDKNNAAELSNSVASAVPPRRRIRFDLPSQQQLGSKDHPGQSNNFAADEPLTPATYSPSTASTSTPVRRNTPAPTLAAPSPLIALELQQEVLLTPPHRLSDVFNRQLRSGNNTNNSTRHRPQQQQPPPSRTHAVVGGFRKLTGLLAKIGFNSGSRGVYTMTTAAPSTATATLTTMSAALKGGSAASAANPCQPLSYARLPGLVTAPYPPTGKRCSEI